MIIQRLKNTLRRTVAQAYCLTSRPLENLKGKVIILMYHRVLTNTELDRYYVQPGMYVRKDVFEQQMTYLKKNFQILQLSELLDMWKDRVWDSSQRYCAVTFDDGWLDNYNHAYPVLLKYNIPATIFLPTSLIGSKQWFWPDKLGFLLKKSFSNSGAKSSYGIYNKWPWMRNDKIRSIDGKINAIIEQVKLLPDEEIADVLNKTAVLVGQKLLHERILLNWGEIEEMSKHNVSFGSHSSSHAILTKLSPEKIQMEIHASLKTLHSKNINFVPVFCYPNGNYTKEILELVKAAGYSAAVTTKFGVENSSSQKPFELNRIGIHNDISHTTSLFAFHISGVNNRLKETLR